MLEPRRGSGGGTAGQRRDSGAAAETTPQQPLLPRTNAQARPTTAEDPGDFCARHANCLYFVLFLSGMLFLVWAGLMIQAVYAAYSDQGAKGKPCDQPMRSYTFANMFWIICGFPMSQTLIVPVVLSHVGTSPAGLLCAMLLLAIPPLLIQSWGIHMVHSSKTCVETNPRLFYPTEHLIVFQAVIFTLAMTIGIPVSAMVTRYFANDALFREEFADLLSGNT